MAKRNDARILIRVGLVAMAGKISKEYRGWAWGLVNTKSHYYAADVEKFLCGVDMGPVLSEELLDDDDDHPENCLKCLKSLVKRRPMRPVPDMDKIPMKELEPFLQEILKFHAAKWPKP